ncbi:germination protein YpeB [Paenibacillus sp. KS-LC4]|uniref:germination protein YpeB n=1 Tax=Paenibacillus sp. KS-LC4 TaxID=2979727 RepID=UPI0030CFE2C5
MVYKRISAVLFPIAAILLVGSLYWGYQEHQEKNTVLMKAENQYQRAFHDLTYHVDKLHEQLGHTLAVNSTSQAYHRKGLVNVWRLTSQAQNEINQLPLSMLPFDKAEDFLSRISNFAYKTSVRDLTKQPLSEDEFKTLKTLYASSKDISQDLQSMQEKVLSNHLRWMDVELSLAAQQAKGDQTIVDGFKGVDKKVSEYPEINWGPSVSSMYEKRTISMLSGKQVTPDEIKQRAIKFAGKKGEGKSVRIEENGKGTEYASYSAVLSEHKSGNAIHMDFSQKGGQLIAYMDPREIGEKQLSAEQARAAAEKFLKEHGFNDMQAVSYDVYDNAGTFSFVGNQGDVLIYPDKLTIKVALDNGDIAALQANEYVFEHHKRTLPKAGISKADARKALNPQMKVSKEQMALIKNDDGNEVLCYEYTGRINDSDYRIYINADSGMEESIEVLSSLDKVASSGK